MLQATGYPAAIADFYSAISEGRGGGGVIVEGRGKQRQLGKMS